MSVALRYLVAIDRHANEGFGLRIFDLRHQRCVMEADDRSVTLLLGSGCWPLELRGEGSTMCGGHQVKCIVCGLAHVRHLLRAVCLGG